MRIRDIAWAPVGIAAATWIAATAGAPAWLIALAAGLAATWVAARAATAARAARSPQRTGPDAETLQRALRRRDEQLAHTAHELRTPLTSVITALEMLREGYAQSPAETAEFLDQATVSARHIGFLINDVLDDAALAAGQLRMTVGVHPVRELLSCAMQVIDLQARSRGIHLRVDDVDEELRVHTDPRRFQQIVFNLVGNALKFTAAGDRVELDVEAGPDRVRFRVVDLGPGVPLELRGRLFSPFARGDGEASRGVEGTGLGLHVCSRLVAQLGGSIGYEPGQDRGSVFWFDQPLARSTQAPKAEIAPVAACAR